MRVFKTITAILIIAVLGVGVSFVLRHTDNLKSGFETFYVKYDNHHLASENTHLYPLNTVQRFDVVYPLDFIDKGQTGYSVQIVPNAHAEEIIYMIDGIYYLFSEVKEITSAFDIKCEEGYFTLTIPKNFTIKTVLDKLYPNSVVKIDESYFDSDEAYYTLIISSYNGANKFLVNFAVSGAARGVALDITRIEF